MQVTYSFRHMPTSERAKERTSSKLERISRLEEDELHIDVVFSSGKPGQTVEFRVSGAQGPIQISETQSELSQAVDIAIDRLDQILSKDKARRKSKKGNQGAAPDLLS